MRVIDSALCGYRSYNRSSEAKEDGLNLSLDIWSEN